MIDFEIFRVWPWPLTPKGHLGSKKIIPFESPYMTSYLTSMDTISPFRIVLEIMPVKILKAEQNGGFWPFKGQGQESIFFFHRKGTSSHQTASFEISRIKISSRLGCTRVKERKKFFFFFFKKSTNPYMLGICTSVHENFSETKFC